MTASSARALLLELQAAGVSVSTDGRGVTLQGRAALITPELKARVVRTKHHLLQLLPVRGADDSPDAHVAQTSTPKSWSSSPSDESQSGGSRVETRAACATAEQLVGRSCTDTPIVVDFETRAPIRLDQVGGRSYARHPEMEVLCAVLILPDGAFIEWTPDDPPPLAAFELLEGGVPIMAHNAHGFDRFIWERLGWPSPNYWIDTLPLARLRGLPGKLEGLAEAVLDITKDIVGRDVTLAVGRLDRSGRFPLISPATKATMMRYCRVDALIVRKAWEAALAPSIQTEPDVRALDLVINDRGFLFDAALANGIIACEARLAEEARERAGVEPRVLASPRQLKRALAEAGVRPPDVRRNTLLSLLDDPELPDDTRALLLARLASSGIASHKLRSALRRVDPDGRVRDSLSYYRAHTGRWAGHGFQPQNLPRGADFKSDADVERAIDAVMRGDLALLGEIGLSLDTGAHEVCASLVRACVCAPAEKFLGVVDYAQIEARALLWIAGDAGLAKFVAGIDPYQAMAGSLFGIEPAAVDGAQRMLGKALVLGCGYQMGSARFESYASSFDVDWFSLGITPEQAVDAWRSSHPAVAGYSSTNWNGDVRRHGGLWRDMQSAAERAAQGGRTELAGLVWERRGSDVTCILPSGRPLFYRNVQLELHPTSWGEQRLAFTYEHHGQRVPTYGGKLTENIVQAVCRDVLAEALVRLDRARKRIVLHVHDEIVAELDDPSELAEMEVIMCEPPCWARGLPLKAAGHVGTRYRK